MELGVEKEEFCNVVGFPAFVDVYVDRIAFPSTQELDVVSGDAVTICSDSSAFP
jgi:hypothetical protein